MAIVDLLKRAYKPVSFTPPLVAGSKIIQISFEWQNEKNVAYNIISFIF